MRRNMIQALHRWCMVFLLSTSAGIASAQSIPLSNAMSQIRQMEDRCEFGNVLGEIMPTLEAYPAEAWNRKDFVQMLRWAWGCFTKVTPDAQQQIMNQYATHTAEPEESNSPPLANLLEWLNSLQPTTTLQSDRARLAWAIWHHLRGNDLLFYGYAMAILQQSTDPVVIEQAIIYLAGIQYYGFDRPGMLETARVAARLAPHNRGSAWCACRSFLALCKESQLERARDLVSDLLAEAPESLVAEVALQLTEFISAVETMAYDTAMERLWELEEYLEPGPMADNVRALFAGIDPLHFRSDPASKARLQALSLAAQEKADTHPDPQKRAWALMVLARCYQVQGLKDQSAPLFEQAAVVGDSGVREFALLQAARDWDERHPERAIAALEASRRYWEFGPGGEIALTHLARLYLKTGRFAAGLELFEEVERRCKTRFALVDLRSNAFSAGKAGCLYGVGRKAEADAIAMSLLLPHGYGNSLSELSRSQLRSLYRLLRLMGREEEAELYMNEALSR